MLCSYGSKENPIEELTDILALEVYTVIDLGSSVPSILMMLIILSH